jgi:molecular chaperone DnaK (HSP70)
VTAVCAVGIDLGTTHCAIARAPLSADKGDEIAIVSSDVPQLVAPGEVESRPLLPSFVYLPHASELPPGALSLPWPGHPSELGVGEIARMLGAKSALRLV